MIVSKVRQFSFTPLCHFLCVFLSEEKQKKPSMVHLSGLAVLSTVHADESQLEEKGAGYTFSGSANLSMTIGKEG